MELWHWILIISLIISLAFPSVRKILSVIISHISETYKGVRNTPATSVMKSGLAAGTSIVLLLYIFLHVVIQEIILETILYSVLTAVAMFLTIHFLTEANRREKKIEANKKHTEDPCGPVDGF